LASVNPLIQIYPQLGAFNIQDWLGDHGEPTVVRQVTQLQAGRVTEHELPGGGMEQVGQVYPGIQVNPQFAAPSAQDWFADVGVPGLIEQPTPEQAGGVGSQEQAGFALVQVRLSIHPLIPLHLQVAAAQQTPATNPDAVPVIQAEYIPLLQVQFTGTGGGSGI
jgi:hypothetical protein